MAKEEAAGRIAPSMRNYFEKQALELGQARLPEHFTITLSARDGKLLYLSTRGGGGIRTEIVLEGNKEYEADEPSTGSIADGLTAGIINNDGWRNAPAYADENVDRLAFCPRPGVGLPDIDLIQAPVRAGAISGGHVWFTGNVPRLNVITGGENPYRAGELETVTTRGHLRVISLTVGTPAVPLQVWKITAFQLFQDHWIGTQMALTGYAAALADALDKLSSNLPTYVADYQLMEARPAALDASAFEVGTCVRDKAGISDNSTGNTLTFTYDKNGGTLKEQAEAARKKESQKDLKTP